VVTIYFVLVLVRVTLLPATVPSAIWPASGVFAAGVLLLRRRQKLYCLAATLAGAVAMPLLMNGSDMDKSLANLGEAWAIVLLATLLCGPNPNFSRGRTLAILVGGAILPACFMSAATLWLLSPSPRNFGFVSNWLVAHTLGAAVFLPAFIILMDRRRFLGVAGAPLQLAGLLVALAASALVFFATPDKSLLFALFPMAMLLTFRHGPIGSASAALVLACLTLLYVYGVAPGQAGQAGMAATVQQLQMFLVVVLLTTLPAAGAIAGNARMRSLLARRTALARIARSRADQASAAKGEFLANMSHEIRTPLNGVIGLADALSRTELAPSQRDMLRMILASGKALTGLLSDALDMARAESGQLRLSVEPIDLRRTVGEAAYLFEGLAREKGLQFEVDFDLDAPGAAADSLRVKQVVSNLISNAVKFTDRGRVSILTTFRRAGEDHGVLQVTVRDSGPGFDESVKARLFQRFEQADASVTRRFGGSGLGLSIAYRLARMMGGALTADGQPDQGAVFTFTAPFAMAEVPAEPSPVEAEHTPAGEDDRRLCVLLAEDNHINQKVIKAMIGELVDLTVVADGEAAVEAFHRQSFDVILMDTHMPVLDGLSATRRIREAERHGKLQPTPIVSLTADAMPQHVEAAKAAGADLHVSKPITAETLVRALHTCVQIRASTRAA
jgi:signal transduction histidine kinase/CheY-like chemotaxis protein